MKSELDVDSCSVDHAPANGLGRIFESSLEIDITTAQSCPQNQNRNSPLAEFQF